MATEPIPADYNRACPYLICDNAVEVVKFIVETFGATQRQMMKTHDGKLAHGEVKIGDSVIMVSDGMPGYPKIPAMVHVYVENSDEVYAKALTAGGKSEKEMETMPYGDRSGAVKDMGGNTWWISSRVKEVSAEEMQAILSSPRE